MDNAAPLHIEHYRTDFTLRFPKPGVAGSIPAGGTTSMLHGAPWCSGVRQQSFRIGKTADMMLTRRVGTGRRGGALVITGS